MDIDNDLQEQESSRQQIEAEQAPENTQAMAMGFAMPSVRRSGRAQTTHEVARVMLLLFDRRDLCV